MVGRIATYIHIDTVPVDSISVGLTQARPNYFCEDYFSSALVLIRVSQHWSTTCTLHISLQSAMCDFTDCASIIVNKPLCTHSHIKIF